MGGKTSMYVRNYYVQELIRPETMKKFMGTRNRNGKIYIYEDQIQSETFKIILSFGPI